MKINLYDNNFEHQYEIFFFLKYLVKLSSKVNGGVIITLYFLLFLSDLEQRLLILLSILIDFGTPNIFQFPIKYLMLFAIV